MISIITVNWNSYDFLNLLIESESHFSNLDNQIIVIDNSLDPQPIKGVHHHITGSNIGHGKGLNLGVQIANSYTNPYIMFVDCDCHFLRHGWDEELANLMTNYDLIAGKGVSVKPIRPACMIMKKEVSLNDWCDTEGYRGHRITPNGFDVAIQAYYKIVSEGKKVYLLEPQPNRYGTLNGEEFSINSQPFIYHHWHGSHLKERQVDFVDDLIEDKNKLFSSISWKLL